jgi:hypothetical protein
VEEGYADYFNVLNPILPVTEGIRAAQRGEYGGSAVAAAGVLPIGKVANLGAKTIVETKEAVKKAEGLSGPMAKAYEKLKDMLALGGAGKNQHALSGDLKGKSAVDLAASGKGRGGDRVIYSETNNEVIIHNIVDYHKK